MEADSQDKVAAAVARIRERLSRLLQPIVELLEGEALDMMLLIHNHERAQAGEMVSATVIAPGTELKPSRVVQTLMAVVRQAIHVTGPKHFYERPGRAPIERLGVIPVDDREMVLVWNERGQCIGELLLKRGECRTIAGMLGLLTRHDYSAEQLDAMSGGLSKPEWDVLASKLERDVREMCTDKPLSFVAAAIHGLVCGNPALRELLSVIDATCEDETKRARVVTIRVP